MAARHQSTWRGLRGGAANDRTAFTYYGCRHAEKAGHHHMTDDSHFSQRARERGGIKDTKALFAALRAAFKAYDAEDPLASEYVEFVKHIRRNSDGALRRLFRFKAINGQVLYAVECNQHPLTILTQEQVRAYRGGGRSKRCRLNRKK